MPFDQLKRREFITLLGGSAAAWPLAARARRPAMPVIGYLNEGAPEPGAYFLAEFRKGLGDAGYFEGRNVAIEYRWAYNQDERLPELATDLIRRGVSVIVTPGSGAAARAARLRPQQFRSSSASSQTRSRPGWSQVSTDRAAMLPVLATGARTLR
jgi:putative ABC transport system substrate-binding protein